VPALILLALLLLPDAEQRAREFFDRIRFEAPHPDTDEGRRVAEVLLRKETWLAAHRSLEERLGPMPDGLAIEVDFTLEGEDVGWGAGDGRGGRVRFNLAQLTERQKHIDETEAKRREALGRGRTVVYKVPPIRMDRLVFHELTHVFQRGCDAPGWFTEGMAQLIADDPNHLAAFANSDKKVLSIDEPLPGRSDVYARGHAFWMWLDSIGAVKKTADLVVFQHRPWKQSLEEATGFPWSVLTLTERDWSEKEMEKHRVKEPDKGR
jgi:hypothetical protein